MTTQDHARELGATMLFGEKYGEHVRVVEIQGVSRELCGGTHVRSTAEIGAFVLTRETSSSQGVRRIEAHHLGRGARAPARAAGECCTSSSRPWPSRGKEIKRREGSVRAALEPTAATRG